MATLGTCLWFDDRAEEAAAFYTSVLPRSRVVSTARYPADPPGGPRAGSVMTVEMELDGRPVTALNGGPAFSFTEAVSLVVRAEDQEESDRLWEALQAGGGRPGACGWLTDRFGLSWQVYPAELDALTTDPDPGRAARAFTEMLRQGRIDVAAVRAAADGTSATG